MILWVARYAARILAVGLAMLAVEFASFFFMRESGMNRLYWVPVSFALVAYGGYDTVRRMPLIWGVVVGAMLAGVTSLLSLVIGAFLMEGQLRIPAEVDPVLLFTTLLMTSLIGAIVGGVAGVVARSRRRDRARRTAIRKLSYMPTEDADEERVETSSHAVDATPDVLPALHRTADSR